MFVELLPILRNRPLMLTLALAGDNAILVNVIPKRLKDSNSGDDALTTPLTVTGTPDELDREFAGQLVGFTEALRLVSPHPFCQGELIAAELNLPDQGTSLRAGSRLTRPEG